MPTGPFARLSAWFGALPPRTRWLSVLLQLGALGLIVWLIVRHLVFVDWFAVNIPCLDDYDAVLDFVDRFATRRSAWDVVAESFRQHNEHRVVIPRLLFLLQYATLGHVDFRQLCFLACAGLVAAFVLLWAFAPRRMPILLVPVAALFFHCSHWEGATWAMVSVPSYLVLCFAIASLGCLSLTRRWSTGTAALFAVCAVYTQANGMFVLLAGACVLALQRRRRDLLWFAGIGLVCVVPYFFGYSTPPEHPSLLSVVSHPLQFIEFLLTLLGAPFESGSYSGVLGLVFLCAVPPAFGRHVGRTRAESTLFGLLVYLLLSCASIAASRAGLGLDHAFNSRYRIVVMVLYSVVYLQIVGQVVQWSGARSTALALWIATCLWFHERARITETPRVEARTSQQVSGLASWASNSANMPLYYPDQARARRILDESVRLRTYRPPRVRWIRPPGSDQDVAVIEEE